jgi:hypothetical protein
MPEKLRALAERTGAVSTFRGIIPLLWGDPLRFKNALDLSFKTLYEAQPHQFDM